MNISKEALKGVTYYDPLKAFKGYTLLTIMGNKEGTWLIDMEGRIVHRWKVDYMPGLHAMLQPNGNLLYAGWGHNFWDPEIDLQPADLAFDMTQVSGVFLEIDWDSNVVWQMEAVGQNHSFFVLPNDNILYTTHATPESIVPQDLLAKWKGGRPGSELTGGPGAKAGDKICYMDNIIELNRNGQRVWEWIAYEHLDPEIDAFCVYEPRSHAHTNAIWKCKNGDLIFSPRHLNEVVRIEYPGGKVVARYGRGKILHQHDCQELENGNILIFDNGTHRSDMEPPYSRSVEIDPETDEIVWEYKAESPTEFFSEFMGGNERLPNGNTIICESNRGRIFEVTREGEIVWEYLNPFLFVGTYMQAEFVPGSPHLSQSFRAHRYDPSYPGLEGKDLNPDNWPWENLLYGVGAFKKDFNPLIC